MCVCSCLSLVGVNIFQILAFAEPSNLDRTLFFPQWLVLISFFKKKEKRVFILIFFSLKRKMTNQTEHTTHLDKKKKKWGEEWKLTLKKTPGLLLQSYTVYCPSQLAESIADVCAVLCLLVSPFFVIILYSSYIFYFVNSFYLSLSFFPFVFLFPFSSRRL